MVMFGSRGQNDTTRLSPIPFQIFEQCQRFFRRQVRVNYDRRRRRLLEYLKRRNPDSYQKVIGQLGIRK